MLGNIISAESLCQSELKLFKQKVQNQTIQIYCLVIMAKSNKDALQEQYHLSNYGKCLNTSRKNMIELNKKNDKNSGTKSLPLILVNSKSLLLMFNSTDNFHFTYSKYCSGNVKIFSRLFLLTSMILTISNCSVQNQRPQSRYEKFTISARIFKISTVYSLKRQLYPVYNIKKQPKYVK